MHVLYHSFSYFNKLNVFSELLLWMVTMMLSFAGQVYAIFVYRLRLCRHASHVCPVVGASLAVPGSVRYVGHASCDLIITYTKHLVTMISCALH